MTNWCCYSLVFPPVVYSWEKKASKDEWLRRVGLTKEGGWCLLSCFSKIYVIAPFGWILTPGHVHHGLEENSLEFQWSCWPCLLGFFGETKLQICNLIQLCYCNSASSPSIYFYFFRPFSQSLFLRVIKLWGIIQFSSFGLSEDWLLPVVLEPGLFPLFCRKSQESQESQTCMQLTLWISQLTPSAMPCANSLKQDQMRKKSCWLFEQTIVFADLTHSVPWDNGSSRIFGFLMFLALLKGLCFIFFPLCAVNSCPGSWKLVRQETQKKGFTWVKLCWRTASSTTVGSVLVLYCVV